MIKNYLRSIYDKTGVSDRLELALFTLHHRALADAAERGAAVRLGEERLLEMRSILEAHALFLLFGGGGDYA